jgi:hypothetical protein
MREFRLGGTMAPGIGAERKGMLSTHLRRGPRRALLLAGVSGIAVLAAAGIASAGGSASQAAPSAVTITAKFQQGRPFLFFSPRNATIAQGGTLTIKNGRPGIPHTFSLVRQSLLPKTRPQRQKCFDPGHICRRIAVWHQALDNTVDVNPVDVGQTGWDTAGGLHKTGDSVFFNRNRPRALPVSAPAGSTLYFMCAIHPWMQGTIAVR